MMVHHHHRQNRNPLQSGVSAAGEAAVVVAGLSFEKLPWLQLIKSLGYYILIVVCEDGTAIADDDEARMMATIAN